MRPQPFGQTCNVGVVIDFSNYMKPPIQLPPSLGRRAFVHGHCHQKALAGIDPDKKLFEGTGIEAEIPDWRCCGLAGCFGFEENRSDVSMKIGERALLPRVRELLADTLIAADGFSCREQILQATGRPAMHLAEVIRMALRQHEWRERRPALRPRRSIGARVALPAAGAYRNRDRLFAR